MDLRCLCVVFNDSPGIGFKREDPARGKLNQY